MKPKSMFQFAIMQVVVCLVVFSGVHFSLAKEWPSQPITIVIGMPAGSTSDLVTRTLIGPMAKSLGVPIIIDNKPGATELIALNYLSKAKPDGYTVGVVTGTQINLRPFIRKAAMPYDPVKAFSYICKSFVYDYGIVVRADAPWKTIQEFIEAAKKSPKKLNVAIAGTSYDAWLGKIEREIPGFKVTRVFFQGATLATTALLGGHVDACFGAPMWKPYVDAGRLRLLVWASKEKHEDYPQVPTFISLGYKFYAATPSGYVAPAGLPEEIRGRLEKEFQKASNNPEFKNILPKYNLREFFQPGKEFYEELMTVYRENEKIAPELAAIAQAE